jgi:putative tricarboxylic transport membrane protein
MMWPRNRTVARAAIVLGMLASATPTPAGAQPIYQHLHIVVPSAPGGGWDVTARAMQPVLQRAGIVRTSSIENVPGAGGTIGLARFVTGERSNVDVIMMSGLAMLGPIIYYRSLLTLADVTPIARLISEYEVVVVPAASPYRSLDDLIRSLHEHPESVSWAGGPAGGNEQMLAWLIADAVGGDPRRINYIPFSGNGEANPAIIGGQVSLGISPLASISAHIEAGTVRALAISSAARLPSLDIPTLREQGIDLEFETWRSVIAPPGVSAAERQRLEDALEAMTRSPAWRETLERFGWNDRFLKGPEFVRFVATEEQRLRSVIRRLGTGGDDASASSGSYPAFVLAGLISMAIAAAVGARRTRRQTVEPGGAGWTAVMLVAAGILVELALMERLGFIPASTALFWLTARAFDARHPARDGILAVVVSAAAYVVFARLLDLSLPPGLLAAWLT